MNNLLSETYNIDTQIQRIQTNLYEKLKKAWNTNDIDAYGRVYRYEYDKKVIPHIYSASQKEYKSTLYDDKSSLFFIDDKIHTTEDEFQFNTGLKIVFMLNLDDVKTSSERVDADVKRDVISILRIMEEGFVVTGYENTIGQVFNGFDTSNIMSNRNDTHPLHVFAITGDISYFINDKCE